MSDAPPPRTGASSRPETRRRTVVLLVGAAGLAAVDLIVKAVAEARLASGEAVDLGLLMLRLHHNPGVAFSLGAALPSWVVIAATGAIIAGLTWYLLIAVPTLTRLTRV